MVPRLTIDPFLLAVPPISAGRQALESYVQDLLQWSDLRAESWLPIYMSELAPEALERDGCFPFYPRIKEALAALGMNYIEVRDLNLLATFLLTQAGSLEENNGVKDVIVDATLDPNPVPARPFAHTGQELIRTLVILAFAGRHLPASLAATRLTTKEVGSPTRRITVRGQVVGAYLRVGCPFPEPAYPFDLNQHVTICETFPEVVGSLDPLDIWKEGLSDHRVTLAIRLALFAYARDSGRGLAWKATTRFALGHSFVQTLDASGFQVDTVKIRRLLRCCCETIMGDNLPATHQLREGPGAEEPQIERGRDRAWRRDVDHEFHLHYWERPERHPELACVGPHNYFFIPA